MNKKVKKILSALFLLISSNAFATVYDLPAKNQSLVGEMKYNAAELDDTIVTVAKRYDVGFNAVENANPDLNIKRGFAPGTPLAIPTEHLLPNRARRGIVINLPEMRLYYYPAGSHEVYTYPIGIGKIGKTIPIKQAYVTRKTKNPTWTPPADIREFNMQQGIVLPKIMPAGPDNPLGPYAIYTSLPTYLIHSTIFPESIGTRASFGCIRMYENDIESFYPFAQRGIPIAIINTPIKIGWQNDRLYMESHEPLEEHGNAFDASLPGVVHEITTTTQQPTLIDWELVSYLAKTKDGIPHEVGIRLPQS